MKTDIQIAMENVKLPIAEIAEKLGLSEDAFEPIGKYKGKVSPQILQKEGERGKLILVTAMHPGPFGEGKTTISVGLGDGLQKLGKRSVLALREPSLGPVFGIKGGACGGGYSQVVPMEEINLHFTGDFHAITTANNLLAAVIDNHIYHGNELNIDPGTITWKRCMDMNDRQLRYIIDGVGGKTNGVPREDKFQITAASEMMAIFCLAEGIEDLKMRVANILIGETYDKKPVYAGDLKVEGAIALLLMDAIKPNLVQSLEHTPCFVHGGPFANIAHGCNSMLATNMAIKLGEYAVTEAGFGADLGAEKFFDIKSRKGGLNPDCVVLVVTLKAVKHQGEGADNPLLEGMKNVMRHVENIRKYGYDPVVAINVFSGKDTEEELQSIEEELEKAQLRYARCTGFTHGAEGMIALAKEVIAQSETGQKLTYLYEDELPIKEKFGRIVKEIYRGKNVVFSPKARKALKTIQEREGNLPVCIAKTQYSFSDRKQLRNVPEGFTVTIEDLYVSRGAGFVVGIAGSMMTMPGLGKHSAFEEMDVTEDGVIIGLS